MTLSNSGFDFNKEMGLGIGGNLSKTGGLTIVLPNFKDVGEFTGNLFQGSDFANDMWKDLNLNIKVK